MAVGGGRAGESALGERAFVDWAAAAAGEGGRCDATLATMALGEG